MGTTNRGGIEGSPFAVSLKKVRYCILCKTFWKNCRSVQGFYFLLETIKTPVKFDSISALVLNYPYNNVFGGFSPHSLTHSLSLSPPARLVRSEFCPRSSHRRSRCRVPIHTPTHLSSERGRWRRVPPRRTMRQDSSGGGRRGGWMAATVRNSEAHPLGRRIGRARAFPRHTTAVGSSSLPTRLRRCLQALSLAPPSHYKVIISYKTPPPPLSSSRFVLVFHPSAVRLTRVTGPQPASTPQSYLPYNTQVSKTHNVIILLYLTLVVSPTTGILIL